jgi:signal transduction histidine kinase
LALIAGVGLILWEQAGARDEAKAALALNEMRILSNASQKIVLQVVRQNQADTSNRESLAEECKKSLAHFKDHLGKLQNQPQDLQSKADRFARRTETILGMKPGIPLARSEYESLYLLAAELTSQLDTLSDAEARRAEERANQRRTMHWIILGALIVLVGAPLFLVLVPVRSRIAAEVGALEKSRNLLLAKKEFTEGETTAWSLFVCHAGQRIRKAVNDIVTHAATLEEHMFVKSSGENADYAAWIRERGTQILGVVNDTLNLAFIESRLTPVMPRAIPLTQLLHNMTPHLKPLAENKALTFSLKLPPEDVWVMGDGDQIWRMVEKIFNNAVKYTSHGEVSITVSALPDGRVTIAIRDTGCGIPPEALPHIFDPQPYEEEAETNLEQGLGINLSVAQQLASHMGSIISAHSEIDKGTTFLIDMPGCTSQGQLLAKV